MKIRIMSDLHIDVNMYYPLELEDKDTFTLVAGDVSGLIDYSKEWIDNNIHNGIIVAGNHIVYNKKEEPLQLIKKKLSQMFPIENNVSFLDYETGMVKIIDDIVFIGTTLYTDYKYGYISRMKNGKMLAFPIGIRRNECLAYRYLNDFRVGHYEDKKGVRQLLPKDYRKIFRNSFQKIKELVEQYKDKKVIIITHHCPSPKCIARQYKGGDINASYVSNLESFIKKHNNIKAWVCGHVHNRGIYDIGNCKVILNPRGYEHRYEGIGWNPNLILDTEKWEVMSEPYVRFVPYVNK